MNQYNEYSALLKYVIEIGKNAAKEIIKIYDNGKYQIDIKTDDSPVTNADIASNEIICDGLLKLDSSITIISEENMFMSYEERKDKRLIWSVDPLDGTKEFIKKNGEFTINIALIENGIPVLGVLIVPVINETYYAVKGQGSFLEKDNIINKLQCGHFNKRDKGLRIPCSNSHINKDTLDYIHTYDEPQMIQIGSALKFMLLAKGEAEIYPRFAPTMEWDTAAPQIIVEEAGGSVLNGEYLTPLVYNKESLVNPGFIAKAIEIS